MKRYLAFFMSLMMTVSILPGCADIVRENASSAGKAQEITVTDQIGREIQLDGPAQKIVSVYYLSTSLLLALGAEDRLVGIEKKADSRGLYRLAAPQLLDLPAVGSGKEIDVEQTAALDPDLVIIPKKLKDSVEALSRAGMKVLVVNPETEEELYECVALLGTVTGRSQEAQTYLDYCAGVREKVEKEIEKTTDRPKVYLSSASSYLSACTAGMYQTELIRRAGGQCVTAEISDSYWTQVSGEQIARWEPQFWFWTADAEYKAEDIRAAAGLSGVPAIQNGELYQIPSEIEPWDYPAASSILGLVWMAHILHPEAVSEEFYQTSVHDFYRQFFDLEIGDGEYGL